MTKEHPLLKINPRIWNNIPFCLSITIQNMLTTIYNSGEQLFDY